MPRGLGMPHLFLCYGTGSARRCLVEGSPHPPAGIKRDDTERVEAGMVWERVAILTFLPALAQKRFAQLLASTELKKSYSYVYSPSPCCCKT